MFFCFGCFASGVMRPWLLGGMLLLLVANSGCHCCHPDSGGNARAQHESSGDRCPGPPVERAGNTPMASTSGGKLPAGLQAAAVSEEELQRMITTASDGTRIADRMSAIIQLADCADSRAAWTIAHLLATDEQEGVRLGAFSALLLNAGLHSDMPELLGMAYMHIIEEKSETIREAMLTRLRLAPGSFVESALLDCASRDSSPAVRIRALRMLPGTAGKGERLIERLITLRGYEKEEGVQVEIELAIERIRCK